MERIEKQLERIQEKDRLHALVDELQDGENVLIIRQCEDGCYQFRAYGEMSVADALYMTESYKNWLFNG
jgi:hypothetical protein